MAVALKLEIEKMEAALAAATNPRKKLRLERDLASLKLAALHAESGSDEDDEDDEEDDEDDKASKAAKRAEMSRKKAEAAKHKAKADEHRQKAAEYDEQARKCMGDEDDEEDEEAKAMRAELDARLAASASSGGALAALADQAAMNSEALERVKRLERDAAKREMSAAIHEALSARRITKSQAKNLEGKSPDFVRDYLAMHPKAIVATEETQLEQPRPTENADIDPKAMAGIDAAIASLPANLTAEQKQKIRQDMINGRRAASVNGAPAPGRY